MIKLYRFLCTTLSPLVKLYFYARCLYGKDRKSDVRNHFGIATKKRPDGKLIWIHAASIGESTSALTYINHLLAVDSDLHVLLTTITVTSSDILLNKLKNNPRCFHQFVVADNPSWVRRFLNYWKPQKAFFIESEIWPNTLEMLYKNKIPVYLLNARLSPKSYKRWGMFRKTFSFILSRFTKILAQSEIDRIRFADFSPHNTFKVDNLKYANPRPSINVDLLSSLQKIGNGRKIFVAASTHKGEEEIIVQAHKLLKENFDILTVIIPRHLTRIDEIQTLLKRNCIKYSLRSELNSETFPEIICVNSFGEVGTFFELADVTFVGGSLVQIGGHNIYEPVMFGKPVMFGPYMDNALEVRQLLLEKNVAFEVKSVDDIVRTCSDFFSNPHFLQQIRVDALQATKNKSLQQIDQLIEIS
ncbi:MAG: 3-deoxy-D-manno-octulosonic acid transferase [Alphaproteobacteria bacterium]|nr:3-deoxy-D-manno-octulosonic acid transferase [Alphaproteobacteria bacterium]